MTGKLNLDTQIEYNPFEIVTYRGNHIRFDEDLSEITFDIKEIAYSLANLCRFTGHTARFYSVLEHSLKVMWLIDDDYYSPLYCLHGLLHDAHEAYTGDLSTPWKRYLNSLSGDAVKKTENKFQDRILESLNVPKADDDINSVVKSADMYCYMAEADALMYGREHLFWRVPIDEECTPSKSEMIDTFIIEYEGLLDKINEEKK